MSNHLLSRVCTKIVDRLAHAATTFHLWCAEQELRLVDVSTMPAALREARARNLDLLREYRRRGEFPRNRHDPERWTPCFIDAEGRQCAVACLMHESGDGESAAKVASEANFARIRQMEFAELDAWADDSGFTKAELARIQPAYEPTPEQLKEYYNAVTVLWVVGGFAMLTIVANCWRLFLTIATQWPFLNLGIAGGIATLGALYYTSRTVKFSHTPSLEEGLTKYFIGGLVLAGLCFVFAIVPNFWKRSQNSLPGNADVPTKLWQHGHTD